METFSAHLSIFLVVRTVSGGSAAVSKTSRSFQMADALRLVEDDTAVLPAKRIRIAGLRSRIRRCFPC